MLLLCGGITLYTEFYEDIGVVLQAMEGDILLDAMCDLIDKGIVSLPIHDALYVEQANIDEAENALKKAWANNLGVNFEPFVDVDTPWVKQRYTYKHKHKKICQLIQIDILFEKKLGFDATFTLPLSE